MKHLLSLLLLLGCSALSSFALAWDGFDADTTDLVEIIPDAVPETGATVEVRYYETDTTVLCLVEHVERNRRTIEVVVRDPDGKTRTLVMEGRPR